MMTTLLKKTNYSKNKTIDSEAETVNIFVGIAFGGNGRSREANRLTYLDGFFFSLKQQINTPKLLPEKA